MSSDACEQPHYALESFWSEILSDKCKGNLIEEKQKKTGHLH